MKMKRLGSGSRALRYGLALALNFACASTGIAQVSPNEILDPQLKALESQYFSQLKTINQQIAKAQFPFPFYLSRVVGLDPSEQVDRKSKS